MGLFGIYVHFGFCQSKCPYCDFASIVSSTIDENAQKNAYEQDLIHYAARTGEKTVSSIFFGGGTPSLMSLDLVSAVLKSISKHYPIDSNAEISLEANPNSISLQKMKDLKEIGVNRLSLGVQALNDEDLLFLGRKHTAEEAKQAVLNAQNVFDNVSMDLIYGRPNQTLSHWKKELALALDFKLKHLSLYQLSLEEGSLFYKRHAFLLPENDLLADMFDLTDKQTYLAGLSRYEVSNHAQKGYECRHNLLYWSGGEWIGIGSAAHSRFKDIDGQFIASSHKKNPKKWLKTAERGEEILSTQDHATELILMALRTEKGISRTTFKQTIGQEIDDFISPETLLDYQMDGLMIADQHGIRTTAKGLALLDGLIVSLVK